MSNPSGQSGFLGKVADWWDGIPTEAPAMGAAVAVLGTSLAFFAGGSRDCQKDPLAHVYHPSRLTVVDKCAGPIIGTVYGYRKEHDGDYHVGMKMDSGEWTNLKNAERQHGLTVVEFVPLLPRPPKFYVGQRLRLVGTKVLDKQHGGWVEMHPVFAYEDVTPPERTPQPNQPKLAPSTEEAP